jgi:hypothetical protein
MIHLSVQLLSVQYGYRDSLGIGITYSTCTVIKAQPCTDTETHTDTEAASVSVLPISRPQFIMILRLF